MNKLNSIGEFSIILSRGYGDVSECNYFIGIKHSELIKRFIAYVNLHADLIGLTKIEDRQSITDNGCDVYLELRNQVKIGVQIKSSFDASEEGFTSKVKVQYTDTKTLMLDKYYVLLCCEMNASNTRKVNHLTGYFATHKTNYHAIFNPHNSIRIFNPGGLMNEEEFKEKKQLFSFEDDQNSIFNLLDEIRSELKGSKTSNSDIAKSVKSAIDRPMFNKLNKADKFIEYLELDPKTKPAAVIEDINDFISKYSKLSPDLRNFYYLIIQESIDASHYVDALEMNLYELDSLLSGQKSEILGNIKVLDSNKYNLLSFDEDEPDKVTIHVSLAGDYNLIKEIKNYSVENNIELKDIFITGDFGLLDE